MTIALWLCAGSGTRAARLVGFAHRAGSGVVRIDPLRFLGRMSYSHVHCTDSVRAPALTFCVVSFCVHLCSVYWLIRLGCQYQCK